MSIDTLATWHELVRSHDPAALAALIADDAVFHSPVVHRPQVGQTLVVKYLQAAFKVFFNPSFRYVREVVGPRDAVLQFELEVEGVVINGVDMIRWRDDGRIVDFKVMLRPLRAVNVIHQKMAGDVGAGRSSYRALIHGKPLLPGSRLLTGDRIRRATPSIGRDS